MIKTLLTAGAATIALAIAVPAMAQHAPGGSAGGGASMGGGPSQTGMDARAGAMGPSNASPTAIDHASSNSVLNQGTTTPTTSMQPTTNPATGTSQGPYHASPNGAAHANEHSVLSGTAGTPLTNVTTGTAVYDSSGTQLGTVSRVKTSTSGTISRVFVTVNGKTYALSPSAFTVDTNGNLTTAYNFGG
jgi:hypothetical protein